MQRLGLHNFGELWVSHRIWNLSRDGRINQSECSFSSSQMREAVRVWKIPLPFNIAHPAEDYSQYVVECDKLAEMPNLDVEHSRSEVM